ncbi:MAG: DUF3093 domain-containing protein [Actinobacteria bacterium]|jgi:hypothetical protein|nr:DUF3093 domain-containing protein [Actinomycetota bacterium]
MEIVKIYREALHPSVGIYLIIALLVPIIILTAAPFSLPLGIALAAFVFLGISVLLVVRAPRIEVNEANFRAGKATIERKFIGAVSAFSGQHAREQRGVKLDARAWTLFRGYIDPVVKVELTDPNDPTPYWLISTRRPMELAQALRTNQK